MTAEMPFKCPKCNRTFKASIARRHHLRSAAHRTPEQQAKWERAHAGRPEQQWEIERDMAFSTEDRPTHQQEHRCPLT